jgi:hypothetical protein
LYKAKLLGDGLGASKGRVGLDMARSSDKIKKRAIITQKA